MRTVKKMYLGAKNNCSFRYSNKIFLFCPRIFSIQDRCYVMLSENLNRICRRWCALAKVWSNIIRWKGIHPKLDHFFLPQVRDIVEECTCPTQFPMIHVAEGKYRIGDTKVTIYVRVLRSHVMVRVGGGWDTLSHYLEKHDPCRCRNCEYRVRFIELLCFSSSPSNRNDAVWWIFLHPAHRSMVSAKLIQKAGGSFDLGNAQVHYERWVLLFFYYSAVLIIHSTPEWHTMAVKLNLLPNTAQTYRDH